MIPYLIAFIVLAIIYFGFLIAWYILKKNIFWKRETIMLIVIGASLTVIQTMLYISEAYGLFLISLVLQAFYCIICPFTLKNSLHLKEKHNTYME